MESKPKNIYLNCLKNLQRIEPIVLWIFLLNLLIRIIFIKYYTAEFTDGIFYLEYHFFQQSTYLPIYPFLIKIFSFLGQEPQVTGRLVSILMASLCIFPIFYLTKTIYNKKSAVYSCLFFTFCPIIFSNSIRVMSDSTHLFFYLVSLYYGIHSFLNYQRKDIFLFLFFSGIAAFTRPEAILFIPLIAILFFIYAHRFSIGRAIRIFTFSGISWYLFIIFIILRLWITKSSGYFGLYKWSLSSITLCRIFDFLIAYLKAIPFASIYPVFLLFVFGIVIVIKQKFQKEKKLKLWLSILFYVLFIHLFSLSIMTFWSMRYLFCTIALIIITAGGGLNQLELILNKRWLITGIVIFCLVCAVISSAFAIYTERDFFGDIRRSAEYIRNNLRMVPVYSDEEIKTKFWSKGKILAYKPDKLEVGQYIVLHSFYTDLEKELKFIKERYNIEFLYQTKSKVLSLPHLLNIAPSVIDYQIPLKFREKETEYISVVVYIKSFKEN